MGIFDRLLGRQISPDARGVYPTHAPLATLDNRDLMKMFKKEMSGAPTGGLFGGWQAYGGSYTANYRSGPGRLGKLQTSYGGTTESVSWVFACVSLVASTAAAYPWRMVRPKDGETVTAPPPDLLAVLNRPNTDWTYFDLVEAVVTDCELVGNSYILKDQLNGLKQPASLRRLLPDRVQIALNPDGTERGYVYTVQDGLQIPYEAYEVMHFKYPNPMDPHYGMGTVEAIAGLLDRHIAQTQHLTGFFQNGARISGVLTIPSTMSDTAFERLKQTYAEQFAGSAAAYKMLIAEGATDYRPITQGPAASGVAELMALSKDEILSAFGVPEFLLGGAHQAGVEKMEEAQNIFLRAMIPRARRFSERITNDLARLWDCEFRMDPHANEPMSVRIQYAKEMIGAGARVQEAREAMGLPPLLPTDPEFAQANKILVPNTMIPLEIVGQPPRPPTSMPIDKVGEHGSTPALPPGSSLEQNLHDLPEQMSTAKRLDALAAGMELLLERGRERRDKASAPDGEPEDDKPHAVAPGPWAEIPALVSWIEHKPKPGSKYSDDEPRDDHGRWTSGGGGSDTGAVEQVAQPITAAEARGNSRPVSADEFQRLAAEGRDKLAAMSQASAPTTGLDTNWEQIKADSWTEVQKSWGGATIDAHSGVALASNAEAYALTVKAPGMETVSIPEGSTQEQFNAAMDQAKVSFGGELQNGNRYLGVFHDDATQSIQVDPVIVVGDLHSVETIGAYTHAIGGAYKFSDGNGYWPPHVAESKGLLATAEEALKAWGAKYSPDQARDDHGRFADGGGSASDGAGVFDASGLGSTPAGVAVAANAIAKVIDTGSAPVKVGVLPESDVATARSLADGSVAIHPDSSESTQATALVHEYGHVLDRSVMGTENEWFTQTDAAKPLYDAMNQSPTVQGIRNGDVQVLQGDPQTTNQLLQGREMFARAFEQYVATRSGDPTLQGHIESTVSDPLLGFQYWPPAEFTPIAAQMDKVLPLAGGKSVTLKSQTISREWTPPRLPRGFEPITKATTTVQQDLRDAQARALRHGVDVLEPVFRKFFREQRGRVIDALAEYGDVNKRGARLRHAPTKAKSTLGPDDLFSVVVEDAKLKDVYLPAIREALGTSVEEIAPMLGDSVLADQQAQIARLADQLASKVVQINETTRLAISKVVTDGLSRGYSIPQIANGYPDEKYPGVMGVFDSATDARAETIARTESAFAFNGIQADSYREAGVGWVEILDGTEWDDECATADGQIWTLDEYDAEPIAHPNCSRCATPSDPPSGGESEKDLKYSDDQPRDDHGRWTSGGGGSGSSGGGWVDRSRPDPLAASLGIDRQITEAVPADVGQPGGPQEWQVSENAHRSAAQQFTTTAFNEPQLGPEQQAAVDAWKTTGGYAEINAALRGGGTDARVGLLDSAIANASAAQDVTLFRGLRGTPDDFALQPGAVVTDAGYGSFAPDLVVASSFAGDGNMVAEVHFPEGSPLMVQQRDGGVEATLARGAQFRVVSVDSAVTATQGAFGAPGADAYQHSHVVLDYLGGSG